MDDRQQPAKADWTFQLNQPTVICLLYIAAYFTVVSAAIGVVLAYVWRGEHEGGWQDSHYTYLIRTFWMAVLGLVGAVAAGFAVAISGELSGYPSLDLTGVAVATGAVLLLAVVVLLLVRCAQSLVKAQRRQPMPKPRTWLA